MKMKLPVFLVFATFTGALTLTLTRKDTQELLQGEQLRATDVPVASLAGERGTSSQVPKPRTWKDQVSEGVGYVLGPHAAAMDQHQWWTLLRTAIAWMILATGVWMWAWYFPGLYMREKELFQESKIEGRTFEQYLSYHFNYWMSSGGIGSMFTLLGIGILSLLTGGALVYAILMQRSPVEGLWLCTVWASAAGVDPAISAIEGGIGMIATIGGLVLLAVLLTTIGEYFAAKQRETIEGRDAVVEGGHLVLLGMSTQTKVFLEELAKSGANDAPKTVVILATMSKTEVEEELQRQHVDTGDLKIVCRSGLPSNAKDLWNVGADVCSRVVILSDPSLPRDEADAIAFGILLTLRGQGKSGWPINGHVSVLSSTGKNVAFMSELYKGKTYALSGERFGRLMVQSTIDQGLCPIFNQLIGFDGDEFYAGNALDLGLSGKTFGELAFWCDKTIPIGIRRHGQYSINPEKAYDVQDDDEVLFLADDDDAVVPVEKPVWPWHAWKGEKGPGKYEEGDPDEGRVYKAVIANFTERSYGCAILFALDEIVGPGSECDIYCSLSHEQVEAIVKNAEEEHGQELKNIRVRKTYTTPSHQMTAQHRIQAMPLHEYELQYILADASLGYQQADEQTVAMVMQMKELLREYHPDKLEDFNPLLEICTSTAEAQLRMLEEYNTINATSLLSRAMAMVAIDPLAHGVLSDLLSATGNSLDIMFLQDYLTLGEPMPTKLCFAEATAIVNRAEGLQQCLVGWSEGDGDSREWILNPKDKLECRDWKDTDRIIVIKDS